MFFLTNEKQFQFLNFAPNHLPRLLVLKASNGINNHYFVTAVLLFLIQTICFTGIFILEHALNIPRSKVSFSLIDEYNQWLQSQERWCYRPEDLIWTAQTRSTGLWTPNPAREKGIRVKTSSFRCALLMCLRLVLLPGAPCPSAYYTHCKKCQMLNVLHWCCTMFWPRPSPPGLGTALVWRHAYFSISYGSNSSLATSQVRTKFPFACFIKYSLDLGQIFIPKWICHWPVWVAAVVKGLSFKVQLSINYRSSQDCACIMKINKWLHWAATAI